MWPQPVALLMFLVVLSGCVTTQADLSKGIDPTKAYVVAGRAAVANNWESYWKTNNQAENFGAFRAIWGLPSRQSWVFKRYDSEGNVFSRRLPTAADENTFIVQPGFGPFIYGQKLSSILTGDVAKPDISKITEASQRDRATVSSNGYLVYDVFEVEPGNWVIERVISRVPDCKAKYRCTGDLTHHMMLKRGKIDENSVGFSVAAGEVVYIGDAEISIDLVEKRQAKEDLFRAKTNDASRYVEKIFFAENFQSHFGLNEGRMRDKLQGSLDISKVVVRKLSKVQ